MADKVSKRGAASKHSSDKMRTPFGKAKRSAHLQWNNNPRDIRRGMVTKTCTLTGIATRKTATLPTGTTLETIKSIAN